MSVPNCLIRATKRQHSIAGDPLRRAHSTETSSRNLRMSDQQLLSSRTTCTKRHSNHWMQNPSTKPITKVIWSCGLICKGRELSHDIPSSHYGGVANHRRLDCLLNRLFRRRSNETVFGKGHSKLLFNWEFILQANMSLPPKSARQWCRRTSPHVGHCSAIRPTWTRTRVIDLSVVRPQRSLRVRRPDVTPSRSPARNIILPEQRMAIIIMNPNWANSRRHRGINVRRPQQKPAPSQLHPKPL